MTRAPSRRVAYLHLVRRAKADSAPGVLAQRLGRFEPTLSHRHAEAIAIVPSPRVGHSAARGYAPAEARMLFLTLALDVYQKVAGLADSAGRAMRISDAWLHHAAQHARRRFAFP